MLHAGSMFKRVMGETEERLRLCPRVDAQMRKEELRILPRICICSSGSGGGGGGAAYITEQHPSHRPGYISQSLNKRSLCSCRPVSNPCPRPRRELFSPAGCAGLGRQAEDWHLNGWNYTSQHRNINEMSNTLQHGET